MNPGAPAPSPAAPTSPTPFTPEAFGKYYLVDRIAMGGMAEIFKAKTFGVGGFENLLVIKRILSHLSENDQFVQMFMDEAKVSALLQNANIVRIYDFGKIRSNYFIAMECVEGKDAKLILRKLSERRKLLPREFAVYIAMEAAKGLDYAHKRTTLQGAPLNIVHRDVSPSNLLVSYHGEVKVADFGIVKAANTVESTDAGTLKGKFEYMSPEQAQGLELDRRSDVFALGIILWEMLTGRRAFKSESEIRTLERIKSVDIEYPSAVNPQVPARLDDIVMRALAKDPDDRYQDARELHADLMEVLYPASPDITQQSLAHFMTELFNEELGRERERLEEGSRLALALHESSHMVELDPEWEEARRPETVARAAETPAPPTPARSSRLPLLVGLLAMLFVAVVVAAIVIVPMLQPPETPPATIVEKEVVVPSTVAALQLAIAPVPGKVYLDGTLVGEGVSVVLENLPSDAPRALKVEAEGYLPYEEQLTLVPGERLRVPVTLVAVPAPPPERPERPTVSNPTSSSPTPAAVSAIARFTSNPSGADVFVDGKLVGRTPVSWDDGQAGGRYTVEYRLGGYESLRFTASLPSGGGTEPYDRTLQERAKGEGKLNVNIAGGGWGDIYVDGKKIGTTPKFGIALPAGTYTVRVSNPETGLEKSKSVSVKTGETVTASFSAE